MKKGWQIKRLGDVCEIIKGRKPGLKATPSDGDLPYLIARVMRGSAEAEYASVKDRNSITVEESETIIICDGSNSGEVFTGFRGILSSTMGKISKKVEIDDNYLRAFLASTFEVFNGAKTGAAIPHLDKEAMYQLEFPLAPLPEQQRIVGLLDKAFEGIATAKANAEKNLQNARALFESYLNSVFTKRGKGWVEKTIKEITSLLGDGLHGTPKYTDGGEYYFINGNNLDDGKIVFKENTKRVSAAEYQKHKKKLTDRTVLVSINGTLGNVAFYNNEKIILGKSACYFNLLDSIDKHFIKYIISSPYFLQYAHREATGATIKNVSLKSMREFKVPLPSLTEQNAIVSKLDNLSKETQRLESIYQQKLTALEELKKSLLNQAFTGEL